MKVKDEGAQGLNYKTLITFHFTRASSLFLNVSTLFSNITNTNSFEPTVKSESLSDS